MKTSKPKAHRMWVNYYPGMSFSPAIHPSIRLAKAGNGGMTKPVPVAVIPLDDVEALFQRAVSAYDLTPAGAGVESAMRAALIAIGVLPKQRKGRK